MSVLGVDLGTSGVRVVAYRLDGGELATERCELTLRRPARGRAELDAVGIQRAAEAAIRAIGESGRLDGDPVEALSFSVLGEAVVPVDSDGDPLGPAVVSMDDRGAAVVRRFRDAMPGGRFHAITGQPLHPMFSAFKIASNPEPWRKATRYLCLGDYLTYRWTGVPVTDYTMAARMGMLDVNRRAWSEEILGCLGELAPWLSEPKLSRLEASGQPVGTVLPQVAARLGLPTGVIVAAGAHDQAAAFLGVGGKTGVRCCISLGSSDCFTVGTTTRPEGFDTTGLASYPIDDSTWITLAGTAAGGWALEWFSGLAGGKSVSEVFGRLSPEPPALIVVPYLSGSGTLDNDPTATGTVHGLTLGTTTAELARAFLEASGLEFARIAAAFERRGIQSGEAVVSGSGARNRAALQARANALGRPLRAAHDNAASRGAALLAARGIGAAGSFAPALESTAEAVLPQPQHAEWYQSQRRAYATLAEVTRGLLAHRPATNEES